MKKEVEMKKTVFTKVWMKSKAYKKVMKLMGRCLKSGGWVEFDQSGEFIDCTLNWEGPNV